MDPNETLRNMRSAAAAVLASWDSADEATEQHLVGSDTRRCIEHAVMLAEAVQAMDGWLSSGGFLPRKWNEGRN